MERVWWERQDAQATLLLLPGLAEAHDCLVDGVGCLTGCWLAVVLAIAGCCYRGQLPHGSRVVLAPHPR